SPSCIRPASSRLCQVASSTCPGTVVNVLAGAVLPEDMPGPRVAEPPAARAEVARAWGVASLPAEPGRDTSHILAAAAAGDIGALVIAGVDPGDLPDPAAALEALAATRFLVSLELRTSAVTDRADVVLPVAAAAEKAGTFVNWEGRPGSFGPALAVPEIRTDLQVLGMIADQMDVHLGLPDAGAARRELTALVPALVSGSSASAVGGSATLGPGMSSGSTAPAGTFTTVPGQVLLATWHNLLDAGRMQDGEPNLAGTARAAVARMSAATAAEVGVGDGGKVTVATERGAITVPAEIADMPDRVVWLPTNSAGCAVRAGLGAGHGSLVTLRSPD
ncbi:MAG TPA: molybdopterin dinucleotide binding domain-containing protein, partial [Streptosporangiaceae bacterium]|nr:molybdopterin dinucleotide binding domain-containing protein [Streptosporangiaceae bacterium]